MNNLRDSYRLTVLLPAAGAWRLASALAMGLAIGLLLAATAASAQKLSSPLGSGAPKAESPGLALPIGQGPGVHGANSPFPNLTARDDVLPWSVLTSVKTKLNKNRIIPAFDVGQLALHQKIQRIQGFMMPLDPGEKQTHFLLSSVPLTCAFCTPGGPESMVEVKTRAGVRYSMEPVVVEGRFLVLLDDQYGFYYRITDAVAVK
jgi:uncharacterized protein